LGSVEEDSKNKSVLENFKSIVPSHKALLCHTKEGLVAIIRQIKPRFHFENNDFVIERLSQHLNQILGLKDLQKEIIENSKSNSKWKAFLEHNIEFYDSFDEMCEHVKQTMKFN